MDTIREDMLMILPRLHRHFNRTVYLILTHETLKQLEVISMIFEMASPLNPKTVLPVVARILQQTAHQSYPFTLPSVK